jgi:hypothetical protein
MKNSELKPPTKEVEILTYDVDDFFDTSPQPTPS